MNIWIEHLKNDSYVNIKKLISKGENLNDENESGETVLMYAIRSHCSFDMLMLLIESGADAYAVDHEGVSVFEMAITYNNIALVHYFLDRSIDVNETKRKSGFTPLMCASCYGRNEIVKLLLNRGADKNKTDNKGFTATDFARKMNKKSVLELLEYNPDEQKNTGYAR